MYNWGKEKFNEALPSHIRLCRVLCKSGTHWMATNLDIDDRLLGEALKISDQPTKKAVVNQALEEYIQRRKQLRVLDAFGTIDFDPDYDHKAGRSR